MATILVVDDQPHIIELVEMYLARDGFDVISAPDGERALELVTSHRPALMILDLMLPRVDGWEVCRRLRAAGNTLPILLLTARDDDVDKIVGLELGADDYLTKPFNPRELVARARALLRRQGWEREAVASEPETLRAGQVRMALASRRAWVADQELALRPREWALLLMLVRHVGEVLSRQQLLDDVWGFEYHGDTRTVDVHVATLREKLRAAGDPSLVIETVWGIGYRLDVTA